MAINSIGNNDYAYQIIQSSANQQRVEQQQMRNDRNLQEQKPQQISKVQAVSDFKAKAYSQDEYVQVQQEYVNDTKSSKVGAYQSVQNFDKRDQIESLVGISVYA